MRLALDRCLAAAAFAVCALPAMAAPQTLQAHVVDPRAFGHAVGEIVTRQATIDVPDGLALDPDSLPQAGQRGRALELRTVDLARHDGGRRLELRLVYQIFLAPREVRVLELPPVMLAFKGTPRPETLRIDAWPLSVAPLMPVDGSSREGLGELRPDVAPPPVDTRPMRNRLAIEAGVALLLLAYLAHVYVGLPWWTRRHRPFGLAWGALRGLAADASPGARRAGYERLHAALNATAGEAVFEHGVERFIAAHPAFAALRSDLQTFFARSRREFFAAGHTELPQAGDDTAWLVAFCRRCRDAERGSA
jgi:mxaA protein